MFHHPVIKWAEYRDCSIAGDGRTVVEALLDAPEHVRFSFRDALRKIGAKAKPYEEVQVHWWYAPFIYIEVVDTRWKHYPCGQRFLVSFDITNGQIASESSANHYEFARKGWGPFADALVGRKVRRFKDCGNPEEPNRR